MTLAKSLILTLSFCCASALAHDYEVGDLHIDHPWSRALPPNAPTGAAYFSITNHGDEEDRLLSVETPMAAYAELHEHRHVDGLMKMQRVDGLGIGAGESLHFQPGGYHVMLFNLTQPLVADETFPMTLTFEHAGSVEVTVNVTDQAPDSHDSGHGDHGKHHH